MDNETFLQQMESDFADLDEQGFDDLDNLDNLDNLGNPDNLDNLDGNSVETQPAYDDLSDFSEGYDAIGDSDSLDDDDDVLTSEIVVEEFNPDADDNYGLSNVTANLSFDIDDVDPGTYTESTELATDLDDEKIRQQLLSDCTALGYAVNDTMDIDTLGHTKQYAMACQTDFDFHELYVRYYTEMLMRLASSTSLHVSQQSNIVQYKASMLKCVNDPMLREVCGKAVNCIYNQILRIKNENNGKLDAQTTTIDPNVIIKELLADKQIKPAYITVQDTKLRRFISTTTSIMIMNEIANESSNRSDSSRRDSLARTLTSEAYESTASLASKDFAYIKEIHATNGGNLTCVCSKCGAHKKVESLMRFIIFFSGGDQNKYVYPTTNVCDCGAQLVFPPQLYPLSLKYYAKTYRSSLNKALDKAKNFSKGSAIITVTPSIEQLPPEIKCIVTDTESAKIESATSVVEVFDSEEWLRAVSDFYKRIDLLDDYNKANNILYGKKESVATHLDTAGNVRTGYAGDSKVESTYDIVLPKVNSVGRDFLSYLAANAAQVAGTNYNTMKGKALVSLIIYLNNSNILRTKIDFDHVIAANATLRLIDGYSDSSKADLNKLDSSVFNNLMIVAGYIDPNLKAPADKNEIRAFLLEHLDELKARTEAINAEYQEFVEDLRMSKYALSCLPITDYRQTSVYSIAQFLINEDVFNIVDEICDRMIINNHSTEYFEFWCRLDMNHTSTLRSRLLSSAQLDAIQRAVDMIDEDVLQPRGISKSNKYFDNVIVGSMSAWEKLKKLTEIADGGNYYRFCQNARDLSDNRYGFGIEFDMLIESFRSENYAEFVNVTNLSEQEFYLGSMFTREELEDGKEHFDSLVFGRYIPIRKEGESAEEYVSRYHDTATDCIDNIDRFKRLKHLSSIYFGSVIIDTNYTNFRVASFMSGMFDSAYESGNERAMELLGVSKLRYNTLVANTRLWTFDDFNINNQDAIALLNSYYFTDASSAVVETYSDMASKYFAAEEKVTPLCEVFDFDEDLYSHLKQIASDPEASDMNSMVEELRCWEFTKGYVERFAGE